MRKTISLLLTGALAVGLSCHLAAAPAFAAGKDAVRQVEALEVQALDLLDKGDTAGAIAKFREALALKPNDKVVRQNMAEQLTNLGISQFNNKDYTSAKATLSEALTFNPNYKPAKSNLGVVTAAAANLEGNALYKAGDIEGAVAKYQEATNADPSNPSSKANLANAQGDLLIKNDDLAGALAKRKEALSYAPTNALLQQRVTDTEAALAAAEAKKAEEEKKNQKN
jgi:tetratricopeptide (TPR) repeat protein